MNSDPLLALHDVGIRHDGAAAETPRDVSFTVHPGEVVLLLGPSGSGKSTLALALDGLIPHAIPATLRGTVRVNGNVTTARTVAQLSRDVGMVFQDPDAQIVTGTLLDEVCFGPENLEVPVDEVLARAEQSLRRVGLWDRRTENPDRLSGGGRQRLAIACALSLAAPLLVLDEPTANLDPVGIDEVYAALAELVAAGDRAIVLIEHNLDRALKLVDRVVVLDREGRVAMDGGVDEIMRDRADELDALGVWLPVASLAARTLEAAGVSFPRLPLTPAELAAALNAHPRLPELPAREAVVQPDAAPAVTVRGLTVTRKGRTILNDVSLTVPRGAMLAIVGQNGAGKTTLLQALAGVVPPPRGTVDVAGLDPARADVRALARAVGFVFQNPEHQFVTHTVELELGYGLRVQGLDEATIAERVDTMLDRFGLTALRGVHPFLLSGGQKRRLSVGTALITGAPVLALDEPTFGQDRERARELLDMVSGLRQDGSTVIAVTHDLQLVAEYASHVAIVHDGALLACGTSQAMLASPLIERAGLRPPPLAEALRQVTRHPAWRAIARVQDLPGARP